MFKCFGCSLSSGVVSCHPDMQDMGCSLQFGSTAWAGCVRLVTGVSHMTLIAQNPITNMAVQHCWVDCHGLFDILHD